MTKLRRMDLLSLGALMLLVGVGVVLWASPVYAVTIRQAVERGLQTNISYAKEYRWLFGVLGAILIVAGFRLYYVFIGLAGVAVGALIGYNIGLPFGGQAHGWALIGTLVGGLVGGALSVVLHPVGVFLLGAIPGIILRLNGFSNSLIALGIAVVLGFLALALFGFALMILTSLLGGICLSYAIYGNLQWWIPVAAVAVGLVVQSFTADGEHARTHGNNIGYAWLMGFRSLMVGRRSGTGLRSKYKDPDRGERRP